MAAHEDPDAPGFREQLRYHLNITAYAGRPTPHPKWGVKLGCRSGAPDHPGFVAGAPEVAERPAGLPDAGAGG